MPIIEKTIKKLLLFFLTVYEKKGYAYMRYFSFKKQTSVVF